MGNRKDLLKEIDYALEKGMRIYAETLIEEAEKKYGDEIKDILKEYKEKLGDLYFENLIKNTNEYLKQKDYENAFFNIELFEIDMDINKNIMKLNEKTRKEYDNFKRKIATLYVSDILNKIENDIKNGDKKEKGTDINFDLKIVENVVKDYNIELPQDLKERIKRLEEYIKEE